MKIVTLRTLKTLPDAYKALPEFFVRIGGEVTRCINLSEAQKATAYFQQDATATLMTPVAHAKYVDARPAK